jgi:carboxylesterase type B
MFLSNNTYISLSVLVSLGSPFFGQKGLFTTAAAEAYAYVSDINATYVGKTVQSMSKNPVPVDEFLGIKFATQERFEKSEVLFHPLDYEIADFVAEPDGGLIINATTHGPTCATVSLPEGTKFSEDCLYLDIYRPSNHSAGDAEPLPVMVWIHGGGYAHDNDPWDFTTLAGNEHVIVVGIKYRLSIFGFLPNDINGTGGMNGILDQVEALKWIQRRISSFGGDPSSITLFGESAGAISTCFLSVMQEAKGLYNRSIMESRSCITLSYTYRSPKAGFDRVNEILKRMECASPPCKINDFKSLTTEELMKSTYLFDFATNDNAVFPVLPIELYKTKGKIIPQQMIVGANTFDTTIPNTPGMENFSFSDIWPYTNTEDVSEEIKNGVLVAYSPDLPMYNGSSFAAKSQAVGDINGLCFMREHAAIASSMLDGDVYIYLYGHLMAGDGYITNGYQEMTSNVAPNFDDSTWTSHGLELPSVFGNAGTGILVSTPLSDEIMSRWANFARFGDPNPRVSASSTELLYAMWEPVSNDVSATSKEEASDTRYLYLTIDGGSMVESNKVKTEQCTAVLPTNEYFRADDVLQAATAVPSVGLAGLGSAQVAWTTETFQSSSTTHLRR